MIRRWAERDRCTTEVGHEKTCLMPYANNKGADQPAHPQGLISPFVVRCLYVDIITPVVVLSKIPRLWPACVSEQAGLSLTWFSHDVAQFITYQ